MENNYNENDIVVDIDGELYTVDDLLESLFLMGEIKFRIDQIKNQVERLENKLKNMKF